MKLEINEFKCNDLHSARLHVHVQTFYDNILSVFLDRIGYFDVVLNRFGGHLDTVSVLGFFFLSNN